MSKYYLNHTGAQLDEAIRKVLSGELDVPLQEKTVTPTDSEQIVIPDSGYKGLSKVTVKASPNKPYTELLYIESSGTQYIDTGFKPNQNTGVTIDFQLNAVSGWQCLFGADNTGGNVDIYSVWHSGSAFGFYYASSNKTWTGLNGTARHTIVASKNTAVADGSSSVSITASTFTTNYPLTLFMMNYRGTIGNGASMKLYSCQIYDNGTLVRDFIPVRYCTGEVGLYDLVEDKFYGNAGTGSFIAGVPITQLPEGCKQLTYIESSGTQHIDTGFKHNQDTRVVCDFEYTSGYYIFSACHSWKNKNFSLYMSGAAYNTTSVAFTALSKNTKHTVDFNKNVLTIDGAVKNTFTYTSFSCDYPMFLFADDIGGVAKETLVGKLYSCRIYDNGILIRDYIPILDSNNIPCLYDKVNQQMYYNKGTGSFTYA